MGGRCYVKPRAKGLSTKIVPMPLEARVNKQGAAYLTRDGALATS